MMTRTKRMLTLMLCVVLALPTGMAYADTSPLPPQAPEASSAAGVNDTAAALSDTDGTSDGKAPDSGSPPASNDTNTAASPDGAPVGDRSNILDIPADTPSDTPSNTPDPASTPTDADTPADASDTDSPGSLSPQGGAEVLAPGTYYIRPAVSNTRMLDVPAASTANGVPIQLYSSNMTQAQQFEVAYDAKSGCYTITNTKSGKVLDVSGARTSPGTKVIQYSPNNTAAQKWVLEEKGGAYTVTSALSSNLVLDVWGAQDTDNTAVQVWTKNGSAAQSFYFTSVIPDVPSSKTVKDGLYTIVSTVAESRVIDVPGATKANGVQMQLYAPNNTAAQIFEVRWTDGYYSVRPLCSGGALDVSGGAITATTVVQHWQNNGTDAQRWAIQDNGDKTYTLLSKKSGLALDVRGASGAQGAKLQLYYPNATKAQRFMLVPIESPALSKGIYTASSRIQDKKCIDIVAASRQDGANAQLYRTNGTLAQKLLVVSLGNDRIALQSINSGHYLTARGGNVVQAAGSLGSLDSSQQWQALYAFGGVRLINVQSGQAMAAVPGGMDGYDLRTEPTASADVLSAPASQVFYFTPSAPLANGYYKVLSSGGLVLDVAGAGLSSGTNVQLYSVNGTAAQVWRIEQGQGGRYTVYSALSNKALDVAGNGTGEGSNVQQWDANGTAAQAWQPVPTGDGWFYLRCANGTWLSVQGAGNYNGANVFVSTTNTTAAQKFRFEATTVTPATLAQSARAALNSANGAKMISAFGGFTLSAGGRDGLQGALNRLASSGYDAGFIMVDLYSGKGVAYNADQAFFSASTIKGPYVASVVASQPNSVNPYGSTMLATINQSSNTGYESLRRTFGSAPMVAWCQKAGVSTSLAYNSWVNYSPRDLAKLWTQNYEFFFGNYQNNAQVRSWYTSPLHSAISYSLGSRYTTYSKPGWMYSSSVVCNDAGIVWAGDRPYILATFTTAPGSRLDLVQSLVQALDNVHQEML